MGEAVTMKAKHPLISLLLSSSTVQYSLVVHITLDWSNESEMFLVLSA